MSHYSKNRYVCLSTDVAVNLLCLTGTATASVTFSATAHVVNKNLKNVPLQ